MTTVLLDSHVVHWWAAEPERLSRAATQAVTHATELAVSSISWYELAWLVQNERIAVAATVRSWLAGLSTQLRTTPITPAIAATAVSLPNSFPGDPVDRIIFATAVEHGWQLVTKDERMRGHRYPRKITIW